MSIFAKIRPEEVRPTLLLTLNIFILFCAYYVIKPIREGLILSLPGGAELKSSVGSAQAVFFILIAPVYHFIAARLSGRNILIGIYLFMALNLLVFLWLGLTQFHYLGVLFFFWVGVFNMLTMSQTYSLCAELFTKEQGKRLFPLIVFGAAAGAVTGSYVLKKLTAHIGLLYPMAVSAALLCVCAVIVRAVAPASRTRPPILSAKDVKESTSRIFGGLKPVFQKRYIGLIAAMILISNLINTNSEYMLGRLVSDHFRQLISASGGDERAVGAAIGNFYATFSFWVNIAVLGVQAFAASRIIRAVGVSSVLFFVPLLAIFSYGAAMIFPSLLVLRVIKTAENAVDYSLNNTAREILFLPLSTKEKYEAKLAADTVFRRLGDALSRPMVFVLMEVAAVGIAGFAGFNLILAGIWIFLVYQIKKERKKY